MIVYQSKQPIYIQGGKMKGIDTHMVTSFSGIDAEIEKYLKKVIKKAPEAEIVMVFYNITNVHNGKPNLVHGAETPTMVMMARYEFVNVHEEPIYLVEDMTTIQMDGNAYTRFKCISANEPDDAKTIWAQSWSIITDQNLIEKLEWNKIT